MLTIKYQSACQKLLILLGYSVPYAFLLMYGDAKFHTMWLYLPMFVGMPLLSLFAVKTNHIFTLLLGNVWSLFSSYLFIMQYQTERWVWYFKPFSMFGFLKAVSVLALGAQFILICILRKRTGKTAQCRKQES